jgi:NADH-quinone oxidoreductase subunit M
MKQLLNWIIFLPAVTALLILLLPRSWSRALALLSSVGVAILALLLLPGYDAKSVGLSHVVKAVWIPHLGVAYHVGIDGLNLPLVILTACLTPLLFLGLGSFAGQDPLKDKRMSALVLMMQTGALGTFLSQDLLLFYVFWEVILIPAYLLIGIYGGPERGRATIQFFLYTFAGSLLMLVGIGWLMIAQQAGGGVVSTAIGDVMQVKLPFDAAAGLGGLLSVQGLLFAAFAAAFFVKAPLVPFHAWLPSTYTQAPLLVTLYLAAILSKMGTYGIVKILMPLFPDAMRAFSPVLMWLAAGGIVYGALLALAQSNLKTAIAYSSLSHVSYILLGLFSLQSVAISGALLQMVNHGLAIAGLFFVVGWLEARRGSQELSAFGGWAKKTPILATFFMVMVLSSVALPGTNGFVGEFMILLSSFKADAAATALAATGMVLGALYMLNVYQRTMFGPTPAETPQESRDLNVAEALVMSVLTFFVVAIGLGPQPFLVRSQQAVEATSKRVHGEAASEQAVAPQQVSRD